jgi:penicillin amidase
VPHIRASSIPDAYFGQGYVVARDRLFQIDLQLRRDLGRLAEAFGARFVPHDHAARLLLYRGDVESELAGLPGRCRLRPRLCRRDQRPHRRAGGRSSLLPPEYDVLKLQPLRWDIADLVRVRRGDMGSVTDEIRRARLATLGLLDLDTLVAPLTGGRTPQLPEGSIWQPSLRPIWVSWARPKGRCPGAAPLLPVTIRSRTASTATRMAAMLGQSRLRGRRPVA